MGGGSCGNPSVCVCCGGVYAGGGWGFVGEYVLRFWGGVVGEKGKVGGFRGCY